MDIRSQVAVWCGRLDLHLLDHHHRTVGLLEFSVRLDIATVWYQTRTLAVMDRDRFRSWLFSPMGAFMIDDLAWSMEGPRVALSIDGQPPYLVPDVFIQQLISVI